jgi:hypothetical protein
VGPIRLKGFFFQTFAFWRRVLILATNVLMALFFEWVLDQDEETRSLKPGFRGQLLQ